MNDQTAFFKFIQEYCDKDRIGKETVHRTIIVLNAGVTTTSVLNRFLSVKTFESLPSYEEVRGLSGCAVFNFGRFFSPTKPKQRKLIDALRLNCRSLEASYDKFQILPHFSENIEWMYQK